MADVASGEGEESDFVIVDTKANFKSEAWKHFVFPVTRKEKGGKAMDRQKNDMQTLPDCGEIHVRAMRLT